MEQRSIFITIAIAILLVLVVAGYFFWVYFMKPKTSAPTAEDLINSATQGTLPSIQTNPLENKPDMNPVDKTNPYANIKTNPF